MCERCGSAFGEENRCPHCRAIARSEPHDELRLVCAVCGGPRVEVVGLDAAARRDAERALVRAWALGRMSPWPWIAALLLVVPLSLTVAWALGSAAGAASAVALVITAIAAGTARARRARARRSDAIEEAWTRITAALLERDGAMTARGLAARLDVDDARADRLLSSLAVHDRVRVDVADDAELVYRVDGAGPDERDDREATGDEAPEESASAHRR